MIFKITAAFLWVGLVACALLAQENQSAQRQPPPAQQNQPQVKAGTGSAVADLQTLDQNQDLYATFDLLDEIPAQQVNP